MKPMTLCSICGGTKNGTRCPRCRPKVRPTCRVGSSPTDSQQTTSRSASGTHKSTLPNDNRPSAHQRLYNHRWREAAKAFLARPENRLCRICNRRLAQCVDHIQDHHGNVKLFWDVTNWQPACISCNTRKANQRGRRKGTTGTKKT